MGRVSIAFILIGIVLVSLQCKKQVGPGGHATIKGKLYAIDFNASGFAPAIDSFYVPAENIFIKYGNQVNVGNDIRTSQDGSFEFNFLNKGKYTIFAVSRDTSIHFSGSSKDITKDTIVEITEKNQVIDLKDFIILK